MINDQNKRQGDHMMQKNKKAQIQNAFPMILGIIIVGMVLIFGYNSIFSVKEKAETVSYVQLKTTLENRIKEIKTDYGSISTLELDIPRSYSHVCFGEVGNTNGADPKWVDGADLYLIYDSLDSEVKKNVFLFPDGSESVYVGPVDIVVPDTYSAPVQDSDFFCLPVVAGKIKVRLEGKGDSTQISPMRFSAN